MRMIFKAFIQNIRDRLKKLTRRKDKETPSIQKEPLALSTENVQTEEDQNRNIQKDRQKKKLKKKISEPQIHKEEIEWDISVFDVPSIPGKVRFHDFDLPNPIMHAIFDLGYKYCTPIQAELLPAALSGQDATGRAQTGTGKTAAFLIITLTHLIRNPITDDRPPATPRILILAPTRELVIQIAKEAHEMSAYCPFNIVSIFGGMDYQKQKRQLIDNVVDIVVATPGRLIDFMEQHEVYLDQVEILVIDEADRMLDMGFIPHVRRIIHSTPPKHKRQTLFFSATLTPEIARMASQWTKNPIHVEIEPEQVEANTVHQIVYIVTQQEKFALLYNIIVHHQIERGIIFCNRRDDTKRIAEKLSKYHIKCAVLSGDVAQKKRLETLEAFRLGKYKILVATDVAGRGIHVENVSHVINYNLPTDPEDYVHRIGRTGRAGLKGISISFACEEDSFWIPPIEQYLGHELKCTHPDESWLTLPPIPEKKDQPLKKTKPRKRKKHVSISK